MLLFWLPFISFPHFMLLDTDPRAVFLLGQHSVIDLRAVLAVVLNLFAAVLLFKFTQFHFISAAQEVTHCSSVASP